VDKVKKDEKTSLGNQASRFARMLKRKSEELARQKAKETCYNPSVLERAWELRTGDYINIKAEIVQEFGSDVFEDHKNVIKGLLQFLNISELCGAELVQTSSDSRSKRCESIPWFMGSDSSSLDYNTSLSSSSSFITKPQSKDNRFLKPESRMPSVLQRRNSIRRSIWLDHGIVTTHSSSGKGFRNLMSDISWDELESVKGGDQYIMKPLTKSAISSKDDDDTGIQIVQEEEEEENEIITLGSGFNGSTFLYRSRENNRLFAVKTIDMIGTDNRNQVTRELATLVQRRSSVTMIQKKELSDMRCIVRSVPTSLTPITRKNVSNLLNTHNSTQVHLFGYHVDEAKINLILEYMNMGGLDRITKKFYKIPERVVAAMAWQIATGLNYLHETKRSIHRDIKPANILWATSGRVKISDFGLASLESEKGSTLLGA
jgi:serine/threonine protein kinase